MPKKNIILGIDPGSRHTGYGLISIKGEKMSFITAGRFSPTASWPLEKRLASIYGSLLALGEQYLPQVVAVEGIFYAKNVKAALSLGHARGVALLVASQIKAQLFEYSPNLVKNIVTGYGRANKEQVAFMVKQHLTFSETLAVDATDALAIAICHVSQSRSQQTVKTDTTNNKSRTSNSWRNLSLADIKNLTYTGKK